MSNRLAQSPSPYLQQHANDLVDWYPWGPEALEKAKSEQKPIFLSIGFAACHWCHVMQRESFSHQETADVLNKHYIPIKVDREERPDLDKIYLQALMLIMGGAGWPMNVWLTPDLKPYHGATYLPHIPRPDVPSLGQQLLFLADAWSKKNSEVLASAERVAAVVSQMNDVKAQPLPEGAPWLDEAVRGCELRYDDKHGGFGQAPKFPQPMVLRYLLVRAIDTEDTELFELVDHTAQAMGRGGLYDQLGGGFHRYCVDEEWTIPHFEKMLSDNAQMCAFYAELFAHTQKPFYKWVVDSLVIWLEMNLLQEQGGFSSSTDAESQEQEGRHYVWSRQQLQETLDDNECQMFAKFFDVGAQGNFGETHSVLTQRKPISRCAKELGWDFELAVRVLNQAREKAFEAREERVLPSTDRKVLASWNAQMVSALCLAARLAGSEEAPGMAIKCGDFLLENLAKKSEETGWYPRAWSDGRAYGRAMAEDLGSLCLAFFDLYELTLEPKWFEAGLTLFQEFKAQFWDVDKQLTALTDPEAQDTLYRPYVFDDNPSPSGNSLFAECCRRHHAFTGDAESGELLQVLLRKMAPLGTQAPTSLGFLLRTAHLAEKSDTKLVLGGTAEQGNPFLEALNGKLVPHLTVASASTPGLDPKLGDGREPGKAYLCTADSCKKPAADTEELKALLN